MPDHLYPPIGRCIYCGETDPPLEVGRFTDEHIIPLSLGGNLLLPQASCKKCEKIINQQIETPVCSQEWGLLRAKRKFPSRNKKKRAAKAYQKIGLNNGSEMNIPLADYATPVCLYKFGPARILTGLPPGTDHLRWTVCILTDHEEQMAMQRKYPEWDRRHGFKAQPYPFARLIAKIGYAYAVAELGPDAFRPLVTDIILGKSEDYFFTVGGSFDILEAIPGGDHVTDISLMFVSAEKAHVRVEVRLFSQISAPGYHVVVGEIDLTIPSHALALERHRLAGRLEIAGAGRETPLS
jgi:hypothetical protein